MMCDGMGWFDETDYKRMLLVYDEILYLLPGKLVPYPDVTGKLRQLAFPVVFDEHFCRTHHFVPDSSTRDSLLAAGAADVADDEVTGVIRGIPGGEQLYTWRVVNADGDFTGEDRSLALGPRDQPLAHALLLNKFLVAADAAGCVPITGKPYIHMLLAAKYRRSVDNLQEALGDQLPVGLRAKDLRHNVVAGRLVEALVPDSELEARSLGEIARFKDDNRKLFERFSLATRRLVDRVESLPGEHAFDRDLDDLLQTDVWEEQQEIKKELRAVWRSVFKSGLGKVLASDALQAAASAVAIGVVPWMSLRAIALATIITQRVPIASWAVSQLMDIFAKRRDVRKHGLYYLLRFADGH